VSIKVGYCCLLSMKKAKAIKKHEEEGLPFSFLKKDVDAGKIKAHWQKIKNRIEQDVTDPANKKKDNNLL